MPYAHPSLEPILADTLGTIVFQEQVIQVAMALAGFSAGEAEGLRRAMSRKRSEEALLAHRERFVSGAVERGASPEVGERGVRAGASGFSGFGFPKAHAAAFGLLAYQSTWLRVHYGPEFLCALLNEQPMGFYPPDALVHEAQRRGFEVRPPDVNRSVVECSVEADLGVRVGTRATSTGSARRRWRRSSPSASAAGAMEGLADLASRSGVGATALEKLAWAGALECIGVSRRRGAGDGRCGRADLAVAKPGRAGARAALPARSPFPPRRRCAELGEWERWSPTTPRPG